MSTLLRTLVLCSVLSVAGCQAASPPPPSGQDQVLDGVWKYDNPGVQGMAIYARGHFAHIVFPAGHDPASPPLTDSAKLALFDALAIEVGAYERSDTIVTAHRTHAKRFGQGGPTFRWTFHMTGDTIAYQVLNQEGAPASSGRAIRIR